MKKNEGCGSFTDRKHSFLFLALLQECRFQQELLELKGLSRSELLHRHHT